MMTEQEQWDKSMKHYNRNVLLMIPLGFVLSMVLMSVGVIAQAPSDTSFNQCADNSTLNISVISERCIDDKCKVFSNWRTQYCDNGCDLENNTCNPSDLQGSFWVAIGVGIFIAVTLGLLKAGGKI